MSDENSIEDIRSAAERVKAEGKSKPRKGRHPVNQPMVDHWLDAMGDNATVAVHINRILPSTLVANVQQQGGARPEGVVVFREGEKVIATVPVTRGVATHRLGRLGLGTHTYTATFEPADTTVASGSTSAPVRVRALF